MATSSPSLPDGALAGLAAACHAPPGDATLTDVKQNSLADKAGIQPGDLLVRAGRVPVRTRVT